MKNDPLRTEASEWPLTDEFDASKWASTWMGYVTRNPSIATDEGTMLGWFANAIMAGYDRAKREGEAELLRLNGPVCPHDGRRASEHNRHLLAYGNCCGAPETHPIHVTDGPVRAGMHAFKTHSAWPSGDEWLRENVR